MRRTKTSPAAACLLLLNVSFSFAQTPAAVGTSDRSHPFVRHAEAKYEQYIAAEHQGDVVAYKALRTKEAYAGTLENLKKQGKSLDDLGPTLKRLTKYAIDISQFAFVRCESTGTKARLIYRRDTQVRGREILEFAVLMLRWEEDAWRIGWIGGSYGDRFVEGSERTFDELLQGRFALE